MLIFLQLLCDIWDIAAIKGKKAPSVLDLLNCIILY